MDNSYKIIEQLILQEMEYRGSRQQPQNDPTEEKKLRERIRIFEEYMKKILTFDLTQRVGKEEGMASQREFGQLLLAGLGPLGTTYEEKLKNLQLYLDVGSVTATPAQIFSSLTVAKMMNTLLYDMNQRKAGNAFEVFMAVLMGGSIEETYGPIETGDRKEDFDIIDLTAPASNGRERYSLKFVSGKYDTFKGSLFNMMNEIAKNGQITYVFCLKSEQAKRKDVFLTFKKFTITKDDFLRVNMAYLRENGFLESFMADKQISDSSIKRSDFIKVKRSFELSLSQYDVVEIAKLQIGIDNISYLLKNGLSEYSKILMKVLDSLNITTENLVKFIYTDDVASGIKAQQESTKLTSGIETSLSMRTKRGTNNAE